jgi:hypothetical protein
MRMYDRFGLMMHRDRHLNHRHLRFPSRLDDPSSGARALEKLSAPVRDADCSWRDFNPFGHLLASKTVPQVARTLSASVTPAEPTTVRRARATSATRAGSPTVRARAFTLSTPRAV